MLVDLQDQAVRSAAHEAVAEMVTATPPLAEAPRLVAAALLGRSSYSRSWQKVPLMVVPREGNHAAMQHRKSPTHRGTFHLRLHRWRL